MHNGHNNGQKIQNSAIFSTYLPNLEALCTNWHKLAIGPFQQLPLPPAPIVKYFFLLKFLPLFCCFLPTVWCMMPCFLLESCHWWGDYQMSPIMSNSMIVVSRGSKHGSSNETKVKQLLNDFLWSCCQNCCNFLSLNNFACFVGIWWSMRDWQRRLGGKRRKETKK